jgi:predicted RecA/RadA family phage recombinase
MVMQGYQPAAVVEFTAPAGGVTAGTGVKIGDVFVVALTTAAAGAKFRGVRLGSVPHAKVSAQAWTEGQQINWDNTAKLMTTVTTGNYKVGVAAAAAANPSGTGYVILHGGNLGAALA